MDKNGNKTGGRQKGTPNKVNASIKARIKDFLIRNEAVMQAAFMEAKPGEKLKFWFNMTNLVCAKQTSSKDDGEWRPGEDIVADWSPKDEWYQKDMDEQYESLLGSKHKNEKVLREQLALAGVLKDCNEFVFSFTNDEIHYIMQHFQNETEGRRALYHLLKDNLDERIDQALETLKIINPIKYSTNPNPIPKKPANHIYDDEDENTQAVETDCAPLSPSEWNAASSRDGSCTRLPDSNTIPEDNLQAAHNNIPEANRVACSEACPPKIKSSSDGSTPENLGQSFLLSTFNSQLKDIPHYLQMPDSEEETKQLVKLYKGHLNEIQENLQRRIQENFDCIDAKYKRRV